MPELVIENKYGKHTIKYDEEDRQIVDAHTWWTTQPRGNYARMYVWTHIPHPDGGREERSGRRKRKTVFLHQLIMKPENGKIVDHINHNGLDNRKENLRVCSYSQNNTNKRKKYSSPYKGICRLERDKKWIAQCVSKKERYASYHDTTRS